MTQGARLAAIMADHDRGPQYAVVECAHPGGCPASAHVEGSYSKTDAELAAEFASMGWSIKPTRCPNHVQPTQ